MASDLEWLAGVVGEMTAAPWDPDTEEPDDCVIWAPDDGRGEPVFLGNVAGDRVGMVGVAFDFDPRNTRGIAVSRNIMAALLEYVTATEALLDEATAARGHALDAARERLTAAIRRERER